MGEHISGMSSYAIAMLERLVGFDTTSRNSNLALIDWAEAELNRLGVPTKRVYDPAGDKANLWATIGPADERGYILSGHTDVVPVDGQLWSSDPFTLTRNGDRLIGRGAVDMKGFLACCLASVPAMLAADLKRPIHLAFSYDEEVGCTGVRGLIEDLRAEPLLPLACFVGEPTSMQVVVAHKAKRSYQAVVTGRPCHSSLAPLGVNAVEYAARLVVFIRELGQKWAAGPADSMYDVPVSTTHTGVIEGGTAVNIVPELCTVTFEFRVLPQVDCDAVIAEVEAFARTVLEPEMHAVAPETGIRFEYLSGIPGLDTGVDDEVTRLAMRLAGRNDLAKVAYGTEAGLFSGIDIPTVVVGPGSIEQAHTPDEFIEVAELDKCMDFIARLIEHCRA
ncbi:acetylornithine deacetylase [Pseudoxanthobacter soli DSM 19599]|uniref:Acetylornithine deacetylase n=2 Tax=Pseudoxanthobacter TaxID=433838 RepID=A0A1M7Z4M6_9HYPH|nr:acetylornithine deacetylase [Pseudoxanthobacter soli DSM 19599]